MGEWPEALPHMILPWLFQGGTDDHDVVWKGAELRFGFYDAALEPRDAGRVVELACMAHARWAGGQQVLVRCQAGINRSGLVTALILMISGMDAASAIALIRERRSPYVLSNAHFEQWLLCEAATWLDVVSDSNAA